MDNERIQTSTPLFCGKFIPPPPRKLWSAGSPTEQLYRNKWTKYRNSIDEKDPWSALDSPHFVDFKELPDVQDNYFDDADEEKNSTPQTFKAHQRLPGLDFKNNNIIEDLTKCTLSAIKSKDDCSEQESKNFSQFDETVKAFPVISLSLKKTISSTITDNNGKFNSETREHREKDELRNSVEKKSPIEWKNEKKTCTIVQPFTFENREKYRQEHNKARRERDSIEKEWKDFRATPLPNFLKTREKLMTKAKTCENPKVPKNSNDKNKIHSAIDIWKKKAFQPVHPKRLPIVSKAPNLSTASRARARQLFDEMMRKKELERQEREKREEAARKKREEEEIAKLRRELVHKAQPIRKYKLIVPKVTKRKLANPTVPIVCKRPRKL